MSKKIDILFLTIVLFVFLLFLYNSTGLIIGSKRMPVLIIIPGLILTAGYILFLITKRNNTNEDKVSFRKFFKNRDVKFFGWLIIFLIFIYFLGFMIAIPLFLFLLSRFFYREGIWQSFILAIGSIIIVQLLFVNLLKIVPYTGLVFS